MGSMQNSMPLLSLSVFSLFLIQPASKAPNHQGSKPSIRFYILFSFSYKIVALAVRDLLELSHSSCKFQVLSGQKWYQQNSVQYALLCSILKVTFQQCPCRLIALLIFCILILSYWLKSYPFIILSFFQGKFRLKDSVLWN